MSPLLGALPFHGLSAAQIAGVAGVYALAFLMKGIFGYGAVSALVVGSSLFIPPHHAVLLAALSNVFTQIQFVPAALREGDRALALRLAVWVLPSIVFGVWVFSRTGETGLGLMIGVFILLLVLLEMAGLLNRLGPLIESNQRLSGPLASVVAGVTAGMIGAGGVIFLSIYVRLICPLKERFRGTILLVGSVFIFWRAAVLTAMGLLSMTLLAEALLLLPIAYVAGRIGTALMRVMPDPLFFKLYQLVLIAAALLMIGQSLARAA